MAKANQMIENPVVGDKLKVLITSEDSDGKLLKVEVSTPPGIAGPPEHYHPLQTETFQIIKGKMGFKGNGIEQVFLPGQSHTVPPNQLHKFWNAGTEEMVFIVELRPALKTEYFFETMAALAQQGKVRKDAMPKNPLHFAALLNEYYGEVFVVSPPVLVQKFMAKVVGSLGKLLGYKGYEPYQNK